MARRIIRRQRPPLAPSGLDVVRGAMLLEQRVTHARLETLGFGDGDRWRSLVYLAERGDPLERKAAIARLMDRVQPDEPVDPAPSAWAPDRFTADRLLGRPVLGAPHGTEGEPE